MCEKISGAPQAVYRDVKASGFGVFRVGVSVR